MDLRFPVACNEGVGPGLGPFSIAAQPPKISKASHDNHKLSQSLSSERHSILLGSLHVIQVVNILTTRTQCVILTKSHQDGICPMSSRNTKARRLRRGAGALVASPAPNHYGFEQAPLCASLPAEIILQDVLSQAALLHCVLGTISGPVRSHTHCCCTQWQTHFTGAGHLKDLRIVQPARSRRPTPPVRKRVLKPTWI